MSHLNPETLLFSLKMSCILVGVCAGFFALTLPFDIFNRWTIKRTVTVTLPCKDIEDGSLWAIEVFNLLGHPTPPKADGSFTIAPAGMMKWSWSSAVIDFPSPGHVRMTGGIVYLRPLAKVEKVPLLPEPGYPTLGRFCIQYLKPFLWLLAIMFVVIFVVGVIGNPQPTVNPHPGPDPHVYHPSH